MYVSAVDSGNLAGHLLTLAPGLTALADQPIASPQLLDGIAHHPARGAGARRTGGERRRAGGAGPMPRPAGRRTPAQGDTLPGLADALARRARRAACAGRAAGRRRGAARMGRPLDANAAAARRAAGAGAVDARGAGIRGRFEPDPHPDPARTGRLHHDGQPGSDLAPSERARQALTQLVARAASAPRRAWTRSPNWPRARAPSPTWTSASCTTPTTNLLAIGYNVSDRRLDASCYDLLASEVRLASFVGIAQGQFPQEHWFALGRQLCIVGGEQLLLSWSGSMFEYLMPLLVMPTYQNTLLDQTYRAWWRADRYARRRDVPWGMSDPATTPSTPTSITSTAPSACPAPA
jgi:cyclic beta-1,2-glucan synthetase